jgi:glycosyltransferase involved in cell wall biosynthesis
MARPLKLFYAAGPGDVAGTYRHWRSGRDDPSQVAKTYSGQFYDVVRALGASAYVVGSGAGEPIRDGPFRIEFRPVPLAGRGGALYHLGQVLSSLRLLAAAWRYGADVMVVASGSGYWFPLRLAPHVGIKVVPTLHCVLWPKGRRLRKIQAVINKLDRTFFSKTVPGIMAVSPDISEQVRELTKGHRPIHEFLPTYDRTQFAGLAPAVWSAEPFRVFYAGRVERDKGVFDLLEIARRFERDGRGDVEFDLAGTGGALAELRSAVGRAGAAVGGRFRCHGHCDKPRMRELFAAAHAVIVPTTSAFIEGLNKVVVEGVLSGRPVVTSSVCPALRYVRGAVVEVPPDDVRAYGDAILRLCDDEAFFESKVAGCRAAQEEFYDPRRGWAATLTAVLRAAGAGPGPAAPAVGGESFDPSAVGESVR